MGIDEEHSRSLKSIQSRWTSLNKNMARFAAALQQVKMINETGKTKEDQFQDALKLYNKDVGTAFTNVSSFNIVKHSAKWTQNPQYLEFCCVKRKKRKASVELEEEVDLEGIQAGNSIDDIQLPQLDRPAGTKQTKRSRSRKHEVDESERSQFVKNSTSTSKATERIADTLDRASDSLQAMLELSLLQTDTSRLNEHVAAALEADKEQPVVAQGCSTRCGTMIVSVLRCCYDCSVRCPPHLYPAHFDCCCTRSSFFLYLFLCGVSCG
ncbi:hypothetical protein DFH28DRAFT_904031 [Melampsora americana]|nr:hypothetical protein DFH28DRAFT_904031 [Melampsora americana]